MESQQLKLEKEVRLTESASSPFRKQVEAETVLYQSDAFTLTDMVSPAQALRHHAWFCGHHPDQYCDYALDAFDLSFDDPQAANCLKAWHDIFRKKLRIFHLNREGEPFLSLYGDNTDPVVTRLTLHRPIASCPNEAQRSAPAKGNEPWFPHLCDALFFLRNHQLGYCDALKLLPEIPPDGIVTRHGEITEVCRANINSIVYGTLTLQCINSHLLDEACRLPGLHLDVTHLPQRKLNTIQVVSGTLLSAAESVTMQRLCTVRGSLLLPHAKTVRLPQLRHVGFDAVIPLQQREDFASLEVVGHLGSFNCTEEQQEYYDNT